MLRSFICNKEKIDVHISGNEMFFSIKVLSEIFLPASIREVVNSYGWEKFKNSYLEKKKKDIFFVKKIPLDQAYNIKKNIQNFLVASRSWKFLLKRKMLQELLPKT